MLGKQEVASILKTLKEDSESIPASIMGLFPYEHLERLKNLISNYSLDYLKIVETGEYIIVYHEKELKALWRRLLRAIRNNSDNLRILSRYRAGVSNELVDGVIRQIVNSVNTTRPGIAHGIVCMGEAIDPGRVNLMLYSLVRGYVKGSRIGKISVERHTIYVNNAYLITHTLFNHKLHSMEYEKGIEVLNYINKYRSKAKCSYERVKRPSRIFGLKIGEQVIVAGGEFSDYYEYLA